MSPLSDTDGINNNYNQSNLVINSHRIENFTENKSNSDIPFDRPNKNKQIDNISNNNMNHDLFAKQSTNIDITQKSIPINTHKTLTRQAMSPETSTQNSPISPYISELDGTENNPAENGLTEFICHYCDATFKFRGYLTRHIKKHAIDKAHHCPFYNNNLPSELRCHSTGGFSRRDTYKTHLRSRHFTYPEGIKLNEKLKSNGSCAHCGKFYENSNLWIKEHIETGQCRSLVIDSLQNNANKTKKKGNNKLKMIKTSAGHSRFISSAESVVEPRVLLNKDALEAIAIVESGSNKKVLSKYGDNQLIMNSEDFKGHKKPKKKYKTRKSSNNNNTSNSTPGSSSEQLRSPGDLSPLSMGYNPKSTPTLTPLWDNHYEKNKTMNTTPIYESVCLPLDIEQQPLNELTEETNGAENASNNEIAINETLRKQMDPIKVNEMHLRETKQYLNFYNFAYNTNL